MELHIILLPLLHLTSWVYGKVTRFLMFFFKQVYCLNSWWSNVSRCWNYTWDKVFKNGPSKICGRQPKFEVIWSAVFNKFYLDHSWILCPICTLHVFTLLAYLLVYLFICDFSWSYIMLVKTRSLEFSAQWIFCSINLFEFSLITSSVIKANARYNSCHYIIL